MQKAIHNPEEVQAARHVLGHLNHPEGYRGSGFTEALLNAWDRADSTNAARLSQAFPEYAGPVYIVRSQGADVLANLIR